MAASDPESRLSAGAAGERPQGRETAPPDTPTATEPSSTPPDTAPDTPRPSAAQSAYEAIRGRIMSGDLEDGARLKEQELASDMGLSRTPVRAAITRLIHEGFAERGEGYSTRVAPFPADEIGEIFEVRRRLESYAAERAATRATAAQIADLDALTTEMEALTPPASDAAYQRIAAINARFHRILSEAAQAPRLMAVLSLAIDIGIVSRTYRTYAPADLVRSARHHRELVDALQARAPTWAASVMSSHILAAAETAARARPARDRANDGPR